VRLCMYSIYNVATLARFDLLSMELETFSYLLSRVRLENPLEKVWLFIQSWSGTIGDGGSSPNSRARTKYSLAIDVWNIVLLGSLQYMQFDCYTSRYMLYVVLQ
jgi:hypothetical protein